jgi:hypothetical protein
MMVNLMKYGRVGSWAGRRFWESRQFYSSYIALFIGITNWITIQYKLLLEHLPFLNIVFSNIWVFMIVSSIIFTIFSILGGHYVHRKRQFRLEQAVTVEENPYLYRAIPGKEKDLMIPVVILQLDTLEQLLESNNILTDERKKQFEVFRENLVRLKDGHAI